MTEGEQSHLLDLMMALRDRREAYALATVVETKGSASASPGSKALIGRDGTLLAGWVGGGCAEATVRQAALGDHISAVRALRSPAGYVAVIASRKRSRLVSDFLRGEGFAEEEDFVAPQPATDDDLFLAHERGWITRLKCGTLDYLELMKLEIPYSQKMVDAFWLAAGGTTPTPLRAARRARRNAAASWKRSARFFCSAFISTLSSASETSGFKLLASSGISRTCWTSWPQPAGRPACSRSASAIRTRGV